MLPSNPFLLILIGIVLGMFVVPRLRDALGV